MPRRKVVTKRETIPDPKYNQVLIARFINVVMRDGKKSTAESIVYDALEIAEKTLNTDAVALFRKAMDNVKPVLQVKSRRVGGSTYQVPVEVNFERRVNLAMRWIVHHARLRGEKTMKEKLAGELADAYRNAGGAVRKKEDTHRMAEANKAFAHYRW